MTPKIFTNAKVYTGGEFKACDVLCTDGIITSLGSFPQDLNSERIDCRGLLLVPGFIDSHTHGAAGVDVNAASAEDLTRISRFFASQGTTSWLASVLTDTEEQTLWCMEQVREASKARGGAELLGIHLEGPFLASEYKGAMPEYLLRKGNRGLFEKYREAADGLIRYITVSPEVEGVPGLISEIADEVVVSLGHSGADYETTMLCVENGARCFTHTMNAMKLMHQHRPAIMGAALESDCWCEAICDGRHLHPATVRILLKAKGMNRVMAVTDSIMAAGLPDGNYKLGVNDVIVKDGDAKLPDGTRAGSTLTTGAALKNLLKFTGKPLEAVLPILTSNPAEALRLSDRKGAIEPGKDADFVLLTPEAEIVSTYVGAEKVMETDQEVSLRIKLQGN